MNNSSTLKLWDDYSLRPYLGEIRRRHGIIETLAMPSMHDLPPSRIETLFVSPLLAESSVNAESDPETWPSGLGLFQALEAHPRLVVLGDPGGGKTTLSNWLAWRLSAGLTAPLPEVLTERIPLPCVLRDMSSDLFANAPTVSDLAVKIAQHLLGDKADAALMDSLQARVVAGQYVLILDGVDEVAVAHRKVIADWMRQAHEQNACVLATSRIVGYEDGVIDQLIIDENLDFDEIMDAPISSLDQTFLKKLMQQSLFVPNSTGVWAERRYLLPFDPQRIAAFAENWYRQRCGTEQEARQKTNDLLTAIAQSDTTRQLARTPNLLSMMAIVHRERAHLPDGKALLYEEIANAYINTIDQQRKILPNDALAPYAWKARKGWLAYIAFQMQRLRSGEEKVAGVLTDERNNLAIQRLQDGEGKDAGVSVDEATVQNWLSIAMQQSGVAQPEATAREYLRWVARRSGLLLPRGAGRYAFVHLSFQEYFCACHLATRIVSPAFVRDRLKEDEPVTKAALAGWAMSTVWRETLVILFELISAEQDADWIVDLTEIVFGEYVEKADFDDEQAELAARLILDRHIRLSDEWKDRLAYRCSLAACFSWIVGKQENFVWQVAVAHGYAADIENILEPSTRLRVVTTRNLKLKDLSPLMKCPNLQYLDLSETAVSDISSLESLTNLCVLDLSNTPVSDVSALANLTHLWWLSLLNTTVSDVHSLTKLTSLKYLFLRLTAVANVAPLTGLTNLRYLSISGTVATDVSALSHLTNLTIIGLPEQPSKT
ncbi:MAG: leucine-rich repeat domain-containing protein [Gallionella sp.]|nr:leucine-rich repeat domain-containing protein [Gallionella sp.]